uniref:Uncharacterized protein n=1 Tax=Setaria italica TaxID=4555 RepID=K3XU10_SETIT
MTKLAHQIKQKELTKCCYATTVSRNTWMRTITNRTKLD